MIFWIYSTIIPIAILLITILFYPPFSFNRIVKALSIALIPLIIYALLIYFLEMEMYIDSGWAFYSLLFFIIPYSVAVLILNIIVWANRKKT